MSSILFRKLYSMSMKWFQSARLFVGVQCALRSSFLSFIYALVPQSVRLRWFAQTRHDRDPVSWGRRLDPIHDSFQCFHGVYYSLCKVEAMTP